MSWSTRKTRLALLAALLLVVGASIRASRHREVWHRLDD